MLYDEFIKRIDQRKAGYSRVGEKYFCKKCGARIMGRLRIVPLHDSYTTFNNMHCGTGKIIRLIIPYCPNCEQPFEIDCLDV